MERCKCSSRFILPLVLLFIDFSPTPLACFWMVPAPQTKIRIFIRSICRYPSNWVRYYWLMWDLAEIQQSSSDIFDGLLVKFPYFHTYMWNSQSTIYSGTGMAAAVARFCSIIALSRLLLPPASWQLSPAGITAFRDRRCERRIPHKRSSDSI